MLWRHIEWRTGEGEVRRGRRLVVSSFSAIGNYDYGFFWYLHQDGTIVYEVKLTGVLSTGAVPPGEQPRHGVLVAPGLNAMVHQHYFNLRLDLDVDGPANSVIEVSTESTPPGPENPHGNAFEVQREPLRTEAEARRRVDPASARWWEIVNPNHRHRLGAPVGYRLVPGENARPFAQPRRAGAEARRVHRRASVGDARTTPASATPPANTPTSIPAAPGCRSGRRRTARSSTGIWSPGTRSATTTFRGPRTGP